MLEKAGQYDLGADTGCDWCGISGASEGHPVLHSLATRSFLMKLHRTFLNKDVK